MRNMKPQEVQESKIKFLLSNYKDAKLEEYKDIKLITYVTSVRGDDKPGMQIYRGKSGKPMSYYYYNTMERRDQVVIMEKENADGRETYKAERKAEKAAFVPDFEVGDIFYTSWGYEQTNVEFYQVIEKVGKHTAKIQEICQEAVEGSYQTHGMACNVTAVKDSFLDRDPITKRVGKYGIKITSCQQVWKWDGGDQYKSWYY